MTPGRRELRLQSLDEVMPDVDRLLDSGHTSVGEWNLAQICKHLTQSLIGSIEGFDGRAPWLVQKLVAPMIFKKILRNRTIPEKVKLPVEVQPKPDLDPRAEAEALRAALRYYQGSSSELASHPFFGKLSRSDWTAFHQIHFAHHLSFLIPNDHK